MRLISAIDRLNSFAPVLVDAAIRGAIVLLVALVLTHLLRRRNAAVRHLIWVGAIFIQLLLPVLTYWGPKWKVPVPAFVSSVAPLEVSPIVVTPPPPATAAGSTRVEVITSTTTPVEHVTRPRISLGELMLALWAMGVIVVLTRLVIGTAIVARLARTGNRIDDGNWLSLAQRLSTTLGIDRPLTLLRGKKLGVPVTWGIVYPVVLLPEDADVWSEERRRFVLVHEMAHVKRLDALTQLAGQFALALFWFNPLVWIANRRMQMEREHACDDYVLRHGTAPSMYAEELLTMVRALGSSDNGSTQPAFAALAMARRSEFEGRMLSILDPVLDRHPLSKGRTLLSAFAALVLVVPLAALQPYQASVRPAMTAAATAQVTRAPQPPRAAPSADVPESFKVTISTAETPKATTETLPALRVLSAEKSQAAATSNKGFSFVTVSGPKGLSCDVSASSSGSTHIHADNNEDGSVVINYVSYNSELCASASIVGKVKYSPDEDDIIEVAPGAQAQFRERRSGIDRELRFTSAGPSYRRDGAQADYDADARRWFASFLPRVLTESGMNVAPRVARWRQNGGVENAMAHIEPLTSNSAKRAHYLALLDARDLNAEEMDKVIASASNHISSGTDLRAVLTRAAPRGRVSRDAISSLEHAMRSIAAGGDKAAVVQAYGQTDDRDMLLSLMAVAGTIESSGDRTAALRPLAVRYLTRDDRALENAFFDVLKAIPSTGDRRELLKLIVPYAVNSPAVARHIIESTRRMSSSGDQSAVLIALARSGALVNKSLKEAYFDAAESVASSSDRARVLQAALLPRTEP